MSKSKKAIRSKTSSQLVTTHKGSDHNREGVSKFYSLQAIEKLSAIYNVIIGKRSNGKTYACLEKIIRTYASTGKQGAYLRRYREDFRGKRGDQLFAAHVSNDLISEGCIHTAHQIGLCTGIQSKLSCYTGNLHAG